MAFRWQWLLIGAVLGTASGRSFAADTREDRAYDAAVRSFQDGMWSRAETAFAGFIRKYPASSHVAEAVLLQAQAEFKQDKLTNAIALLTARRPGAGDLADQYVYWIGEAQFQAGDLPAAAATFISLTRDFPESSLRLRALVEAAVAQSQLRQWPQVDALLAPTNSVFQRAAQSDPASELVVRGNLLLAQARFAQKDFAGALSVLESLASQTLKPEMDWRRAYLLYQVKLEAGDLSAALAATTNLVQIAQSAGNDAWQAEGLVLRGAALEQLGQTNAAGAAYQQVLALNAPPDRQRQAILKIAALAVAQSQFSDAIAALGTNLTAFSNSPAADVALLTLGELQLRDYVNQPVLTNQLLAAQGRFDQFLRVYANSPLAGKAHLDRGWCLWLAGKTNASETLSAFRAAAQCLQRLPPSEDLAAARFKIGDVLFAQTNYAGALENYRAVLEDFTDFPAVTRSLGGQALYQSLRASLALTNLAGASEALEQILEQYPTNDLAASSALLYGQSLAEAATNHLQAAAAREVFEKFEQQFPGSPLRPQAAFAVARTYEQDPNPDWPAAIRQYEDWRKEYPTNELQARVTYALAAAYFQAGNETNAFRTYTNFVAQFPTNELAPLAQYWVADYYFRLGSTNNMEAERNYKLLYQNTNWQGFPLVYTNLAYQARLMAGRAAMGLSSYKDAIEHFTSLTSDTNCPGDLNAQALFAYGSVLMQMESADTNHPLANYQKAADVFNSICQLYPTNESGALAWNEIGDCDLQLTNYDAATNAYAQVINSPYANLSARCRAQIGFGLALEKKAALSSGSDRNQLFQLALDQYLDVLYDTNRRDQEPFQDLFWTKKAGLQALPVMEELGISDAARLNAFFDRLEGLLPQLKDSLEKKRAAMLAAKN